MSGHSRELTPAQAVERFVSRHDGTDNTVRSYAGRLREFIFWAEENDIEYMSDLDGWWLDEFREFLAANENAAATRKGKLTSLVQLLKYCESIEVVDQGLHEKVDVPTLSKEEQTSDDKLDQDEASRLLEFFRNSPRKKGTAPHVVLELMWHVGGRMS